MAYIAPRSLEESRHVDMQADGQTDSLTTILCIPTRDEVIIRIQYCIHSIVVFC